MTIQTMPIIHAGDTGPLTLTLTDNGLALDITAATLEAKVLEVDGTTTNTPAVVVSDGPNGVMTLTIVAATWPTPGDYILMVKVGLAGPGTRVKRTKRIPVHVLPTIGGL